MIGIDRTAASGVFTVIKRSVSASEHTLPEYPRVFIGYSHDSEEHCNCSYGIERKGSRERSERPGLLWMAPDVITFVITTLFYG